MSTTCGRWHDGDVIPCRAGDIKSLAAGVAFDQGNQLGGDFAAIHQLPGADLPGMNLDGPFAGLSAQFSQTLSILQYGNDLCGQILGIAIFGINTALGQYFAIYCTARGHEI